VYGRQGDDGYGDGGYDNGRGYGNQGQGRGQGYDEWAPGSGGRGAGRPVDAYPGRDRYGDNGVWSPVDGQSPGQGRRGPRGGDGDPDAWSPRSRSAADQTRVGRRAAAASGSVGLAGQVAEGHVNEDIDLDEIDPSGHARRAAEAARGGKKPPTGRRKAVKWTAIGISTTLVLILAIGAYVILHLTGNIKHTALLQNGVSQAPEPVDKYGRSPLNILVIGSDTRSNPADCKIGGVCGPGSNADVEMVVHLSADRSNATVMSIPRDTVVTIPHCTDPTTHNSGGGFVSTINSSLQWGPSCTVTAVHDLTGLTIDHFVMVDFVGVETMSNALGGVQVCVTANMYDKDSHLRLNKGENMVQGASALAFVRTRHGFYDGSDLGREKAQHYFLSAMIREVRANMNLADFTTLYKLADAATKALTVDDGLSGVTGLEGLAITMNRVPTDRISFVTMPWNLDPHNQSRVNVAQPYADEMFKNISDDVPYTSGSVTASKSAAPAPSSKASTQAPQNLASPTVAVNKAAVHVQVLNGSGVSGRATTVKDALVNDGFSLASVGGNASSAATTKIYYPSTRSDSAATVAYSLGLPSSAMVESSAYSQVTLVLGADWTSGTTFGGGSASGTSSGSGTSASTPPTTAASAPAVSSLSNAATTGGCVPVNPPYIVK
jgi:LCP family protein required for cell wall assembly